MAIDPAVDPAMSSVTKNVEIAAADAPASLRGSMPKAAVLPPAQATQDSDSLNASHLQLSMDTMLIWVVGGDVNDQSTCCSRGCVASLIQVDGAVMAFRGGLSFKWACISAWVVPTRTGAHKLRAGKSEEARSTWLHQLAPAVRPTYPWSPFLICWSREGMPSCHVNSEVGSGVRADLSSCAFSFTPADIALLGKLIGGLDTVVHPEGVSPVSASVEPSQPGTNLITCQQVALLMVPIASSSPTLAGVSPDEPDLSRCWELNLSDAMLTIASGESACDLGKEVTG